MLPQDPKLIPDAPAAADCEIADKSAETENASEMQETCDAYMTETDCQNVFLLFCSFGEQYLVKVLFLMLILNE